MIVATDCLKRSWGGYVDVLDLLGLRAINLRFEIVQWVTS